MAYIPGIGYTQEKPAGLVPGAATGAQNPNPIQWTGFTGSSPKVVTKDLTKAEPAPVTKTETSSSSSGGSYPNFEVDLEGIWEKAGEMADAQLAPQLANIALLLEQAGFTADESRRAIDEAYPLARRSIQKSVYENFVAGEGRLAGMGTGRGGGRQELLARGGERETAGITALEQTKMREQGAIDRALASYKSQQGNLKTSILGTRGGIQAGYAEGMRANRFNEAAVTYGAAVDQWNANQSFASPSSGIVDATNNGSNVNFNLADVNSVLPLISPATATLKPLKPLEKKLFTEWGQNYNYK